MAWKKRRRPSVLALSFLYLSCGLVFLAGNVYILHSGFVQMYERIHDREELRSDHIKRAQQQNWQEESDLETELLVGLPSLSLSAGNLHVPWMESEVRPRVYGQQRAAADTPLRKLMENRQEGSLESVHYVVQYDTRNNRNLHRKYITGQHEGRDGVNGNTLLYKPHGQTRSSIDNANYELKFGLSERSEGATREQSDVRKDNRTMSVSAADLRRLLGPGSHCPYIHNLTDRSYIASGWTKAVYRAAGPAGGGPGRRAVAVKLVDLGGHDMATCLQNSGLSPRACYWKASQKMLREIVLLQALRHPNIIQLKAYCVPQKPYDGESDTLVAMATELGETIDIIKLLQMSWEDRLRVSYGMTRLLQYLAESPYGPVSLNDFRRQQFVLVDGNIKLTDVDDIGLSEPHCTSHHHCTHYFSSANFTLRTPCVAGSCQGFNEKKNVFNAARHFTTFLLPYGAPSNLRADVDHVVSSYSNATVRAGQLLQLLDAIVVRYRSGDYLHRTPDENVTKYDVTADSDLPGLHDYRCRYSIAAASCTLSVFDQREAEQLCDLDPDCKAFVMSNQLTWTGRIVVYLKNGVGAPSPNVNTTLYVKPSSHQ